MFVGIYQKLCGIETLLTAFPRAENEQPSKTKNTQKKNMHTKALHGIIQTFLTGLISPCVPKRAFGSADKLLLEQPGYKLKSIGLMAFAVYAPYSWNCLPLEIKLSRMYYLLKKKKKLHVATTFFFGLGTKARKRKKLMDLGRWKTRHRFLFILVLSFSVCVCSRLFLSCFQISVVFYHSFFSLFIDMFGFTFVF